MAKLTREDLMSLEEYANVRADFRSKVMEHKKPRRIMVGPHVTIHFENRLIMQYQIQEMLRIERIFEAEGIQEELDTYNPMIPDGTNLKATMMIEFPDPEVRAEELRKLIGIDRKTYVKVGDHEKVFAISNEDLERENEEKTSSVHFLRFELSPDVIKDAIAGAPLEVGIDHENYQHSVVLNDASRQSLVGDLNA
ncbi:MAG: DUF3501 family protein [bacterium]